MDSSSTPVTPMTNGMQSNDPSTQPVPVQPVPVVPNQNSNERVYKVLVVEDEADARDLFLEILSAKSNWEVSTAVDGIDALAKAEATKFDLILLDIVMPRKDGVETLAQIKQDPVKYGTPRVLMLTNIGGDLAIEEAIKLGAVGYRLKNTTEPDELLKVVEEELVKV